MLATLSLIVRCGGCGCWAALLGPASLLLLLVACVRLAALRLVVMSARFLIFVTPSIFACESLLWIDNNLASCKLTSGRFGGVFPGKVLRAANSSRLSLGRLAVFARSPLWTTFGCFPGAWIVAVLSDSLMTLVPSGIMDHRPCNSFLLRALLAVLLAICNRSTRWTLGGPRSMASSSRNRGAFAIAVFLLTTVRTLGNT